VPQESYDYGLWVAVAFNVIFFGGFVLAFMLPKRKREWRSLGVFTAFVVALFVEMYGFPLTIYLLAPFLIKALGVAEPFNHVGGHLWGTLLGFPGWGKMVFCLAGGGLMLLGLYLVFRGWRDVHRARGEMVTTGIYAYMRHPQYAGIQLLAIGMLIQWPTIATLLMWPFLIFAYRRLAQREERELEAEFGVRYAAYKSRVPALVPSLRRLHPMSPGSS
jgi:protein-S-isoprenylcysteine O-methyltransferase Ste14